MHWPRPAGGASGRRCGRARRPSVDEPDDPREPEHRSARSRRRSGRCAGSCRRAAGPRRAVVSDSATSAGDPGSTATAPLGRRAPGGNSASTEPPKPPPMMRAPSAPARVQAVDRALHLGHRHLVVVPQAAMRGVEQAAQLRRGRRPPSASTAASTRTFSRDARGARGPPSGSGRPRRRRRRPAASRPRAPGRPPRTPRGARCSRRRPGCATAPESSVASAWPPSSSGTLRSVRARACRCAARGPPRPSSEASGSSRPVRAPHQSFSIREQSRARASRLGRLGARHARRAPGRARPRAPRRTTARRRAAASPAISSRQGRGSTPAAPSSAAAPRTKARQPARPRWLQCRAARSVRLAEVERARLDPVAAQRARRAP